MVCSIVLSLQIKYLNFFYSIHVEYTFEYNNTDIHICTLTIVYICINYEYRMHIG